MTANMLAPLPENEAQRIEELLRFKILDTEPEYEFDELTQLAATICGVPIAVLCLVDSCRQWFKSRVGLDVSETPRDVSFCSHAILGTEMLVVPNALDDDRFNDNPFVTGEANVRFYAGMPLTTPDGYNLGTLCVVDTSPRTLSSGQLDTLRVLARQVIAQLVLRQQLERSKQMEAALRESEERFRMFMDNSPALAFMKDEEGRYAYVNQAIVRRFGRPAGMWIGHTDEELFPNACTSEWRDNDHAVLNGGKIVEFAESITEDDGQVSHWSAYKFPFRDASGQSYLAGIGLDVTEKRLADLALRKSEAKFRCIVNRISEGMLVVDPATKKIVEANAALSAMLGYTRDEILMLEITDIVAMETPDIVQRNMRHIEESLARDGRCCLGRKHLRRKDGFAVPVDIQVTAIPGETSDLHAVILRDMTAQAAYEEQLFQYQSDLEDANTKLKSVATTDALTGIRNRMAFDERVVEEYERAVRHGRPLSLLLLDVDHFKSFNDTFGHPAGDEVLKDVAQALQRTARATDFVARYGGEEFVVILPDTDVPGAMVLGERFRRAIAGMPWEKRPVTVSVGVATLSETTIDPTDFINEADVALYSSKQGGRNRVYHNIHVKRAAHSSASSA